MLMMMTPMMMTVILGWCALSSFICNMYDYGDEEIMTFTVIVTIIDQICSDLFNPVLSCIESLKLIKVY